MKRAFSSAGSEHLPYKQRVGGSNPSTPTFQNNQPINRAFSSAGSEHLPYKQRVGGSNPSTPTLLLSIHSDAFFVSTQFIDCIYYDCFIISVGFV